jgi:DNA-binding transcriptional ArsR family regulator
VNTTESDALWQAVTDPTRRQLLDILVVRDYATATMLAQEMTVSRQAICKHLATLEQVGLIHSQQVGREIRFSVREERIAEASAALSNVADRWNVRLKNIKRLAELSYSQRNL